MNDNNTQNKQMSKSSLGKKFFSLLKNIVNFFAPNWFFKILLLLLIALPAAYILTYTVIIPVSKFPDAVMNMADIITMPALSEQDKADPEIGELTDRWRKLTQIERYHNSLLELARGDSIGLSLDLRDSTLNLLIHGVNVRRCKIQHWEVSSGVRHLRNLGLLSSWAGATFRLEKEWASVEKSPITVKEAPRDTIEALKFMEEPKAPTLQDVHVTLKFDRHLILNIDQTQGTTLKDYPKRFKYEWGKNLRYLKDTLRRLKNRQEAPPEMWINLEIGRDDALAVYRAIPSNTGLAFIY